MDPVTYEVDGLTAIIRINRPEKLNALDESVIQGLRAAFRRYDEGSERCAILCALVIVPFRWALTSKMHPKKCGRACRVWG